MNYPLLFSTKQCTKCGLDFVYAERSLVTYEVVSEVIGGPTVDRMRRSCSRCGYIWYERCADAIAP